MTAIEYLDQQIKQIAPTAEGISIGRWDDRSTWKVTGTVSVLQQATCDTLFKTFDKVAFETSQIPSDIDSRVAALETRMTATELSVSTISLPKIG